MEKIALTMMKKKVKRRKCRNTKENSKQERKKMILKLRRSLTSI